VLCSLRRLPAQPTKGVLRFPQGSALADIRSLRGLMADVLYSSDRLTAKPLFSFPVFALYSIAEKLWTSEVASREDECDG
jgi:hypothetical protein